MASGRFNWDNEGKVLGKRGGPPQEQRIESRKGEGTEEGGGEKPTPGKPHLRTRFVSLSRDGSRPHPQAQQ